MPGASITASPQITVTLFLLHQEADAVIEPLRDRARALHHRGGVVADVFGREPIILGVLHVVDNFGRTQQRLGGNAAPVEADAAQIRALDDRGLEAELRGADRRHIAAGPEPMMMMSKDSATGVSVGARAQCLRPWSGSGDRRPAHTSIAAGLSIYSLNAADQFGAERAVDGAVIGDSVTFICVAMTILPSRTTARSLAGADRDDGGMRRIDDGGEFLDAVHAEIGDRRGAALIFLRLELARPRARRISFISFEITVSDLVSALRITGVIRPPGIETATPTSAYLCLSMPASVQVTLASGT